MRKEQISGNNGLVLEGIDIFYRKHHLNTQLRNIRNVIRLGDNISWLSRSVTVKEDKIPILRLTGIEVTLAFRMVVEDILYQRCLRSVLKCGFDLFAFIITTSAKLEKNQRNRVFLSKDK